LGGWHNPDPCAVVPDDLWEGFHMNLSGAVDIVAWMLIILGIIFIFWKLIGGSPTEFNILLILLSGMLFKMMSLGNDIAGLKERAKNSERKFAALASDFKEHVKSSAP